MRPPLVVLGLATIATVGAPASAAQAVPFAGFNYAPASPLTHQAVNFTSQPTTDPGATIVSEAWDLDDDGKFDDGSGPNAAFTYVRPGPRQVALRVVDSAGAGDTHRERLVVGNRAPVVSFFPVPAEPAPGGPVTLYSNSYDPDGFIVSYAWDLDADGGFDDAGESSAVLTVPASGAYPVGLRVTDDSGASSTLALAFSGAGANSRVGSFLRLMSPFPIVRVSGLVRKRGIKLRLLAVSAPVGATVSVRCRGRGCAFRRRSTTLAAQARSSSGVARTSGLIRIRRLGRKVLRAGATVQVYVTSQNAIGKYTRLRVRGGRPPARIDSCVLPGTQTPAPCPSG